MGLVAGVLLFGMTLLGFLSYPDYGLILAVSCSVYLVYRNKFQITEGQEDDAAVFRPILVTVFFMLISLSLVLLHSSLYGRVPYFFVLAVLATGIVAWEIVSFHLSKLTINLVLVQILVLFFVLRLSLFEQFPSSMLGVDAWYHLNFLMEMASKGAIPIGSRYSQFPGMHIIAVGFWEIAHIDLQASFILVSASFELVGLLFTFALAAHLTNSRIALVCALLLTILQSSIRWGWWTAPDTVGLSLLPMLVYTVLARKPEQAHQYAFITIVTLVSLVVIHAFSTFVIFVVLTLMYLISQLRMLRFKDAPKSIGLGLPFLILYCLLFLSYWIYAQSGHYYWVSGPVPGFFGEVALALEYGFRVNIRSALGPALSFSGLLVTRSGAGVMLTLAILGSLIMLSPRERSYNRFILSLAGLALIVLAFGFQAVNLGELLPGRWVGFTQYLTIVAAAIGTYSLGLLIRRFGLRRILLVALILSCAMANIMAPEASFDSPLATQSNSYRDALLGSEMTGANFLAHRYEGPILTDEYFIEYPTLHNRSTGLIPEEVRNGASISATQMLILRKYVETTGIMIFTAGAEGFLQPPADYENMFSSTSRWNKMYESSTMSSYVPTVPS
jgi:hypothetical protein